MDDPRRRLPAVGALLESPAFAPLTARYHRPIVVDELRALLREARADDVSVPASPEAWAERVHEALARRLRPSLRPVLNATGVVLHTNLGRAPLPAAALARIVEAASGFSNLEYDLERGERGSRYDHCVGLLRELTGAEDALVVNNCAAALVLALGALATGREVAVSRGELIEIGGSFRVPDIMRRSGARLVEVGTTNRTHRRDYEAALDAGCVAIVKVHRSNFTLGGYTAEVSLAELAELGAERGVPVLHDFGSGLLLDLAPYGLVGEPTARDVVAAGPTVVVMSGDKLLGGPQAGIVLGHRDAVAAMRADPLARALRVDKLTIAALGATLALYRDPSRAVQDVPALAMLVASTDVLRARAERLRDALSACGAAAEIVPSEATVGGGAFPDARIPSVALALAGDAAALERRLRGGEPAVVARVADGRVLLDLRSVPGLDDERLRDALQAALA